MSFWSGFEEKRKWILKDNFILEFKANDDEMNRKIYCCNPWTLLFLFGGDEYFRIDHEFRQEWTRTLLWQCYDEIHSQ